MSHPAAGVTLRVKSLFAVIAAVSATSLIAPSAQAQATITTNYRSVYSLRSLGTPPGVPTNLGGLTFRDSNTLLVGGNSNDPASAIYAVTVTRNASGQITGFSGTATQFSTAPDLDGGLWRMPNGTILFSTYDRTNNPVGQILPGATSPAVMTPMPALGDGGAGTVVPAGMPGAGTLVFGDYASSKIFTATYAANPNGTYTFGTPVQRAQLSGDIEGIIYVNPANPLFGDASVLISQYNDGAVTRYKVDQDGIPIANTAEDFVTGLPGVVGGTVDPVTGDFLFATYGEGDQVVVVNGFTAPAADSTYAQMSDVIMSQYVEGGAFAPNADAIELYNGTSASIDLAAGGYKLLRYDNGSATPTATINLTGTLLPRQAAVYVNSATTVTALSNKADQLLAGIAFSGNDAVVLVKGSSNTVVDSFGQVGNDPGSAWGSGSTASTGNSLIRKPSIKAGRTASTSAFTPSTEWDADGTSNYASLGDHTAYYALGLDPITLGSTGVPSADGWIINQVVGCSGEFRGDSATNGGNKVSTAGAGSSAWGIYTSNTFLACNDNSEIWATYMLGGALSVGQSVSLDFDNGTIRTGKSVSLEFQCIDSATGMGEVVKLYFVGGESYYRLEDSTNRVTTIPFTANGGTVRLRLTGAGAYSLSFRGTTYTGTLKSSRPTINAIRVVNKGANNEYSLNGDEGNVFFNNLTVSCIDVDNDGSCLGSDCNDNDASIYPGAAELCSTVGVDNDCDGSTSDVDANASDKITVYRDADTDGASVNTTSTACSASVPSGWLSTLSSPVDCNDSDPAIKPGAVENCANLLVDNDCDGVTTAAEAVDSTQYYADSDGDTYGNAAATQQACSVPSGYVTNSRDCNDNNAAIKPGATDVCDGVDNNCDGTVDPSSCGSITINGNGGSSFAPSGQTGPIGGSTINVSYSGTDVVFTITKGTAAFGDSLVLYVDSASGGFSTTSGFTDSRGPDVKAVSGYNGTTRATVNFPSGFTADYALWIKPALISTAWKLVNGGDHSGRVQATMTPSGGNTSAATYTVTIPRSALGILPGQQFKFVGTYLNETTAVRSNEGYGEGLPASGNVSGAATFTSWLTGTAPCTSSESVTPAWDSATVGTRFGDAEYREPCNTGNGRRLFLVIDGRPSTRGTWRSSAFDGVVDSMTASFKFSLRNGGNSNNPGDGFSFFWGDASDMSGTRWQGGETGLNALRTDGAGLQIGITTYAGSTPGVQPWWGSTSLASKYQQSFSSVNYGGDYAGDDTCYASDTSRMATMTVSWTRGSGVTVTLQMPGAASATTILNNVGSATLANINPANWHFGFAARNGAEDQHVIIADATVTVTRASATYYVDQDGDGYGAIGSDLNACQSVIPAGYIATGGDCNDANNAIKPGAAEVCANLGVDNDCDGANDAAEASDSVAYYADGDGDGVSVAASTKFCTPPVSGYRASVSNPVDCNDADSAVNPGAAETCANYGVDNNCDGNLNDIDGGATMSTYYADADGDGYGNPAATQAACSAPAGYVSDNTDCNDTPGAGAAIHPGATENCSNLGVDNDCDGTNNAAEAVDSVSYYVDGDQDGYGAGAATKSCSAISGRVTNAGDCNDTNAAVNPGATEVCNTIDDDCDSAIDEGVQTTFYRDQDSDGYGTTATTQAACSAPTGYVASSTDCNDADATVYPGAAENCANLGTDNDCDGTNDAAEASDATSYYLDADGDSVPVSTATKFCTQPYTNGTTVTNGGTSTASSGKFHVAFSTDDNNTWIDDIRIEQGGIVINESFSGGQWNSQAFEVVSGTGAVSGGHYESTWGNRGILRSKAEFRPTPSNPVTVSATFRWPNWSEGIAFMAVRSTGLYGGSDSEPADSAYLRMHNFNSGQVDFLDPHGNYIPATGGDQFGDALFNGRPVRVTITDDGTNLSFTITRLEASPYLASAPATGDCNDGNPAVRPGAVENCANIAVDNDCDGDTSAAEAIDSASYYVDGDTDTYGAGTATVSCTAITGQVTRAGDCNDSDATINPAATEVCDAGNVDENCNGVADNADSGATGRVAFYADVDGDTYGAIGGTLRCDAVGSEVTVNGDCDDSNSAIKPGATEVCDGVDNNCVGGIDEGVKTTFYADNDADGYGNAAAQTLACSAPTGYVLAGTDCNDANPAINPGVAEVCDSANVDEDCDGVADDADGTATGKTAFYADNDGDGYGAGSANQRCDAVGNEVNDNTDCDDTEAARNPTTVWYPDADQDGRGVLDGAVTQCARPGAAWARAEGDLCPNDALKTDPGTCGCGTVDADLNGNGIADCGDATPPATRLALLTQDASIGSGEKLDVTVAVQNGPLQGVGTQVVVAYDRTKLSLDTNIGSGGTFYEIAEGSILDTPIFAQHDSTTGKLVVALGASVGNSNMAVTGPLLRLRFTCVGDYANAASAVTFATWGSFSSSVSNATSQAVTVAPAANLPPVSSTPGRVTFSGVPAPVAYWADATGNGTAAVTIVPPTAVDASSQAVSVSWTRSDSGANLTTFPSGLTTITWSATDSTGNTSTATTMVNVSADSLVLADVALGGAYTAGAFTRGMEVSALKGVASDTDLATVVLTQSSVGGNYRAEGAVVFALAGSVDWSAGCAAVRDPLHTLRRALAITTTTVAGTARGRSYNSAYVVDGTDPSDYLLTGNVDGNGTVDILDFGTFVNQRGTQLAVNTYGGAAMPHADMNGSGQVTLADLTFIQANIFKVDEQCVAADAPRPVHRITVRELRRLGLGDLAAADINRDGVLDEADLALVLQGVEPTQDAGTPDAEQPASNAQE